MPGIVAHRALFGRGAKRIRHPLGCALIVRRKAHPHMAIVKDRVVLAVGLGNLVEALRNQESTDAVACHEGERRLEEIQPAKGWKLVEHH